MSEVVVSYNLIGACIDGLFSVLGEEADWVSLEVYDVLLDLLGKIQAGKTLVGHGAGLETQAFVLGQVIGWDWRKYH